MWSLHKSRERCVLTAQVITCPVSFPQLAGSLDLSRSRNGNRVITMSLVPFSVAPSALISSPPPPNVLSAPVSVKRDIRESLVARNEQILPFISGWRGRFSALFVRLKRIPDWGLIRFTKQIKTFCLISSKPPKKSKQSCRLVVNYCRVITIIGCHSVLQVYSDSV